MGRGLTSNKKKASVHGNPEMLAGINVENARLGLAAMLFPDMPQYFPGCICFAENRKRAGGRQGFQKVNDHPFRDVEVCFACSRVQSLEALEIRLFWQVHASVTT